MDFKEYIKDYEKYIDENNHGFFYAKDYSNVSFVLRISAHKNQDIYSITLEKITPTNIETEAEVTSNLLNSRLIEQFNKYAH